MLSMPRNPPALGSIDGFDAERLLRGTLFIATFLLIWLTAAPFPDLSDPKLLESGGDGNLTGQILTCLLTLASASFVIVKDVRLVLKALTPMLAVALLWFVCSAALSPHWALASRRLVLAGFIIFQCSVFLLLPHDRDQFSRWLAAGSLIVLAICYAGVIFLPELSIHQRTDLAEPELAGNWRGFFTHKNGAGASMAVLVLLGIFVARTSSVILGSVIVVLAACFLIQTESKSSIVLLPPVLMVSFVFMRVRHPATKFIVAIGMPALIGLLTIGSVSFDPIKTLVNQLMSDPSFTGRDEIWLFSIDQIAQRPIFGFGFQAFWGTTELVSAWNYLESWGYRASDAHNGFLNLAVMTGLVGLALTMAWVFVQPLADQIRTAPDRADPALTMLFVQIWLFGLCICGFESELFNGGSTVWFMMVVAIVGLRYQAIACLAR
jgi:O-antigen ligase